MKTKTLILVLGSVAVLATTFGFTQSKKKGKSGEYVFIPMGSTTIDGKAISTDAFWISDHEVTNQEYNSFLDDLKKQGKTEEYEICRVQNDKWISEFDEQNTPYAEYYHTHKAYANYPVLNISYEAAKLYCEWLTQNSEDKNQMFRLPTREEWIYAAKGGLDHCNYAWGGNYLRDKKGQFLCNFKHIGDEFIHSDSEKGLSIVNDFETKISSITSPVDSYAANEYGMYHVCGNVAEMIDTKGIAMGGSWNSPGYDVRITSELKYDTPNPFVGFRPVRVNKN